MLSHRNLLEGAWSVAHYLNHTRADRILAVLPLSFDAGLSQLTSAWTSGATAVLVNYLCPQDVIEACAREQITAITGVPPLWMQLAHARWPDAARATLRYFANTGGRMPKAVLQRLRALFPQAKPYLMYGLTEAFRSTYLAPPKSITALTRSARPCPTHAFWSCAPMVVCLMNPANLYMSAHASRWVTGVMQREPLSAIVPLPSKTWRGCAGHRGLVGDLVRRDAHGFLYFIARNDAQIKSSGYRISPEEIEETIHESGFVSEVAAVGVPDDALGETITLVVVPAVTPFRPSAAVVVQATPARLHGAASHHRSDGHPAQRQRQIRSRGLARSTRERAEQPSEANMNRSLTRRHDVLFADSIDVTRLANRAGSTPFSSMRAPQSMPACASCVQNCRRRYSCITRSRPIQCLLSYTIWPRASTALTWPPAPSWHWRSTQACRLTRSALQVRAKHGRNCVQWPAA